MIENIREIRDAIPLEITARPTHIICCAYNKKGEGNSNKELLFDEAKPLKGYVYDNEGHKYVYPCLATVPLGTIPLSIRIVEHGYKQYIPIPDSIIEKFLDEKQKSDLELFIANFSKHKNVEIKFIQATTAV